MPKDTKGGWRTLVASAIAGCADCCVTMPLDTMGTQLQVQGYSGPVACARAIYNATGVSGMYKGFWAFMLQMSAKSSIRFCGFEFFTNCIDSAGIDRHKNSGLWTLVCGLGAGCVESTILTAPTDRVKVLNQVISSEKGGIPVTTAQLVREKGILTLYQGGLATMLRQSTNVAVRFLFFEKIKEAMCNSLGCTTRDAPPWVSFLSGGIGGGVSVCLNNPIDVAKSHLQAGRATTIRGALQNVVKTQGWMGLTGGLSARVPRLFMSQAIQFTIVDVIRRELDRF